ncbi:MAG: hypothetical protein RLZZ306_3271 [Bacteroidota bacterium]|jgi:hypothetical protein
MKNTTILLLALCISFAGFSQKKEKTEILKGTTYSITSFYHKNLIFVDTLAFGIEVPFDKASERQKKGQFYRSFADAIFKSLRYTIDSIPDNGFINVNDLYFANKKVLSKMSNCDILVVKRDSSYTYIYDRKKDSFVVASKYKQPRAIVYQNHPNLPRDFFLFKENTLEPVRYKCSSYSPVLDAFNTADSLVFSNKPRIMIDGRLQRREFEFEDINLETVKKIDVFNKEDARTYFGQKVKSGLISIVTNDSKFNLDWMLANIRIVGEIQDKSGQWKVIKDTVLTSPEQFISFRKDVYSTNGTVYKINGEFETENTNRKTIDADAMESITVVAGEKTREVYNKSLGKIEEIGRFTNDTVFIKTEKERWTAKAATSIPRVMSEFRRLRKTEPDPTPLYFVDNQEIDSEKLKQFKPKDLEFVESLEGCDAISKYGKRAEFGVVIYRKKKIE